MHCVFHARLLLLHLGFSGRADFDHGHAADQLGQPFLQFFTVVVRGGFFDLGAHLLHTALDVSSLAGAFDDRGVVLVHGDLLGAAQVGQLDALQLDAQVFADDLAAGEDGDVFQHGLATIAEARSFDRGAVQGAAQFVDDQGCQSFTFHFLGHNQERLPGLGNLLEQGKQVLHGADLLLMQAE